MLHGSPRVQRKEFKRLHILELILQAGDVRMNRTADWNNHDAAHAFGEHADARVRVEIVEGRDGEALGREEHAHAEHRGDAPRTLRPRAARLGGRRQVLRLVVRE